MSDGMLHLYSRLEKLALGVQKVAHPWCRLWSSILWSLHESNFIETILWQLCWDKFCSIRK